MKAYNYYRDNAKRISFISYVAYMIDYETIATEQGTVVVKLSSARRRPQMPLNLF